MVDLRPEQMTDDQRACFAVLCETFFGEHHVGNVVAFGRGIKTSVHSGQLATVDFDYLTRLVVLAHDHCVRVEIMQGGPGRIGIALHRRHQRDGDIAKRHPTLEDAAAAIRAGRRG